MIVLNDGGFFGMGGKLAAFDYALVTSRNEEGDVIMPVSEATLKKVAEFSYNAKDAKNNVRVIPANGYSVSEILDADVLNARGKEVAEVENVTFLNGKASRLIVEFDGMMGMGGDQAALNFGDLKIIKESDGEVDFQMSAAQAASFESYKSASK
jgi:sporulation protein YlmC with PRC-barrel domain